MASNLLLLPEPSKLSIPPCQTQNQEENTFLAPREDIGVIFEGVGRVFVLVAPPGLDASPPNRHLVSKFGQRDRISLGRAVVPFEVVLQDTGLLL